MNVDTSELESKPQLQPDTPEGPGSSEQLYTMWLLWNNRGLIARVTGIGVVFAVVLALCIPARYTATTQLMPPDAVGGGSLGMAAIAAGMSDKAGGLGTAAADLLGFKSSGALFVAVLKSRSVQDQLVEKFGLQKVYGCRYRIDARTVLAERTEISEDRKSGVIKIEVSDRDRERAQQIAKAYVDELNRVVATSAMSSAARERSFIQSRMVEVKKEMDSSAVALAEFSSKNSMLDVKDQAKAMVDAVATVQGQLIAAQSELKGLQSLYSEDNFRVRSAKAQVAELSRQLKGLDGDGRPKSPSGQMDYPTIRQLPGLGVTFEDLYRRNKIADTVYEALVQQYEMSKIEEAKDTPKVQVLDSPEQPEVKSYPPRLLIVVCCSVFSLAFSCGWVIVVTKWNTIDNDNASKRLVLEMLATVQSHPVWASPCVSKACGVGRRIGRIGRRVLHLRTS